MYGLLAKMPESNPSIIFLRSVKVGVVLLFLKIQMQYLKLSNNKSVDLHVA
jgi:hypothetical protein